MLSEMMSDKLNNQYIRTATFLVLFGGLLTTAGMSVFHVMQENAFLINLVLPPAISIYLIISILYLYKHPDSVGNVLQLTIFTGAILLCVPAWYFTILASGSEDVLFVEVMPPVIPILFPVTMSIVIFLNPNIARLVLIATWAGFTAPILFYLVNHPEEMKSPRGLEMFITLGPIMFAVLALLVVSQGLKQEVSQLHTERSDLKMLSEHDSLTGLFNRRAGESLLINTIKQAAYPFGIIMFDIDHFKHVNDTYGHDVGDATLRQIVRRCNLRIRSHDHFVRWGGEEFLIIVLETNMKETVEVAEQLRAIISAEPLETGLMVSASFGVTVCHQTDTQETLFKRADAALYEAKITGRNRVISRV